MTGPSKELISGDQSFEIALGEKTDYMHCWGHEVSAITWSRDMEYISHGVDTWQLQSEDIITDDLASF